MKMIEQNEFEGLLGETITEIVRTDDDETLTFMLADGRRAIMWHEQACCENVYLEDVAGDFDDLLGSPILLAEKVTSKDNPPGTDPGYQESFTWTFYKLATNKGAVTLRWYGASNGCYSEEVSFRIE